MGCCLRLWGTGRFRCRARGRSLGSSRPGGLSEARWPEMGNERSEREKVTRT